MKTFILIALTFASQAALAQSKISKCTINEVEITSWKKDQIRDSKEYEVTKRGRKVSLRVHGDHTVELYVVDSKGQLVTSVLASQIQIEDVNSGITVACY